MQQDDPDRSFDEERHEQLTTAPKAVESDADPRVDVTEQEDGVRRIDVADTASVRPGKPKPPSGS
ncbi:multidrug transporter [Clavibacter michiganensis]|uniref:multidrug transporter n=1 Tax=Clavibacter michiganensis TaxID=28447 RepID=UPI000CE93347|nr:multidrug transporter [Clavibacter michiganensis]PPF56947.1 multidrug transporter [Clavibacter michiganensis]